MLYCSIHNDSKLYYGRYIKIIQLGTKLFNVIIKLLALKRADDYVLGCCSVYLELVYLVTALVPSETACLANSPGNKSLTAVWISRDVMVDLLL